MSTSNHNSREMRSPKLIHLINRDRTYKELLEKHPENKEMLERKIRQNERDIISYVTSEPIRNALKYLNL